MQVECVVWVCPCRSQRLIWVFFQWLATLVFEIGSLTEFGAHWLGRWASQQALGSSLPVSQGLRLQAHVTAGDPDLVLYTCVPSTLWTESFQFMQWRMAMGSVFRNSDIKTQINTLISCRLRFPACFSINSCIWWGYGELWGFCWREKLAQFQRVSVCVCSTSLWWGRTLRQWEPVADQEVEKEYQYSAVLTSC